MIAGAVNFAKNFFSKKNGQKEKVADFHTTIIRVDNNFISSSSIKLDERLIGNIYSLNEVIVDPGAEISGNITSHLCNISGKVIGDIIAIDYVEVKNTAVIEGNIRAKSMCIQPGAVINGLIRIEGDIDDRDLIEKIENRLPPRTQKEPFELPYILQEEIPAENEKAAVPITKQSRPSETLKRNLVNSLKPKVTKPADIEESHHESSNSWY
ncbi:polymer-forming cytoskeletal protein [Daejeonella sp. H1SJ63]|uniref:bactofilin family protein n=1 Tax=Daejeonella sp. H1SJ63 TaxID=3034145 RepID=UPI0023EC8F17|nr:polymer-forming cytoskeletal protein [Daejeonella sp. H1SJ63]